VYVCPLTTREQEGQLPPNFRVGPSCLGDFLGAKNLGKGLVGWGMVGGEEGRGRLGEQNG